METPKQKHQRYRENYEKKHPHKNRWFKLRYRASCRGISFTITYEQFKDFCIANDIEGKTGRTAQCLSFDRIDSRKGYEFGNLQILTVSENSIKGVTLSDDDLPDGWANNMNKEAPF